MREVLLIPCAVCQGAVIAARHPVTGYVLAHGACVPGHEHVQILECHPAYLADRLELA